MRRTILLLAFALLPILPASAEDPATDLKSRDVAVRLAAIETLRREGGEDAEQLLLSALGDRDWEVVENAATALGERGGKDAVVPLLRLCITGPVRRIRLAAARALLALAPGDAAAELAKRVSGEGAVPALDAIAVLAVGAAIDAKVLEEAVARALSAKEVQIRIGGARLVGSFRGRDRRRLLTTLLAQPEVSVRAAALDSTRLIPDPDDVPAVLAVVHEEALSDVLSRRALAGLVAVVEAAAEGAERERRGRSCLTGAELAASPAAAARFCRLAGMLAERRDPPEEEGAQPAPPLVDPALVRPALEAGLGHTSPEARAAAVHALGRIADDWSVERAEALALKDKDPGVRFHALRALVTARGADSPRVLAKLAACLSDDPSALVREYAATALGIRGCAEAVEPLVRAIRDDAWEVAVCAAVSLGKTREPGAVGPLAGLLEQRDWKRTSAALVGLGHVRQRAAMPYIIAALDDKLPAMRTTGYEFLRRLSTRDLGRRSAPWRDWWAEVGEHYDFPDLEKAAQEAKKYGYAPTYLGVYEDLDVIVLQSRGDHIEQMLDVLTIEHRLTRSGQIPDAGVHPFAVFVANCTGEITPKDVEQLSWFVRVGGYLFGSCWALHETIEPCYPGVVQKLPTMTEVLDNVRAEACPTDSPYLDDVFGDGLVTPIYVLYGAHLIEVLDPERVEVLIDSPQCADRFKEGNLACWFDAGHGVILDSANHFDLQGLERADGLKTAGDRMAYAIDHMGLSYADARALDAKKVWASRSKAVAEARDLSAFRFITNFVRHKRKVDR